jgi:hypothetical protein
MRPQMHQIEYVWDNGALEPWLDPFAQGSFQKRADFCAATGAQRPVALQWRTENRVISCKPFAKVLPDFSGVVLYDEWGTENDFGPNWRAEDRHLRVINADGALRFRLYPPVIAADAINPPCLYLPSSFPREGVVFGVQVSDGRSDLLWQIDWESGEVIKVIHPRISLRI